MESSLAKERRWRYRCYNGSYSKPVILSGLLCVDGEGPFLVSLLQEGHIEVQCPRTMSLIWLISVEDICVAQELSLTTIVLHCLVASETQPSQRAYKRVFLNSKVTCMCLHEFKAGEWTRRINNMACSQVWKDKPPLLVLINPFSGAKLGASVWRGRCAPLMQAAGIRTVVLETKFPGHALQVVRDEAPLGSYSGIVSVGGDGLLCEVVNGILTREDWYRAASELPIVPIGSGTGNACAYSLYRDLSPEVAICHTIKGYTKPLDAFLCVQPVSKTFLWGVMGLAYGVIAEADLGTEAYRALGPLRWTVCGALLLLFGGSCPVRCKLTYFPARDSKGPPLCECRNSGTRHERKSNFSCEGNLHDYAKQNVYRRYKEPVYGPHVTCSSSSFDADNHLFPPQYPQSLFSLPSAYE